jgi:putative effector of murein hydrolase LrgA (UPF0299 family)
MNKRGEMETNAMIGGILIAFVAIVVGIALFQSAAQSVGTATNTESVVNTSLTTVVNGTAQYLNYRAISDVVIYNETGGIVGAGNYTITDNVVHNGALSVEIMPNATAGWKSAWKVSGTAQPTTYIDNAGARSIAGLVIIFAALAIAVVSLTPTLRSGLLEALGK